LSQGSVVELQVGVLLTGCPEALFVVKWTPLYVMVVFVVVSVPDAGVAAYDAGAATSPTVRMPSVLHL